MENNIELNEELPIHVNIPPDPPVKVYIRVNSDNNIVRVDSNAFITDINGWIEIDSGYGVKYRLAESNYFNKPLMNEDGTYNYKYEDGKVIEI